MKIESPSGNVFEWEGDQPPTAADYAELQKHDAELSVKYGDEMAVGIARNPAQMRAGLMGDKSEQQRIATDINANQVPRVGGLIDAGLEGGGGSVGQMAGTALAPATFGLSIPVGGFLGAAAGNAAGQLRREKMGDQESFSLGQMLGAGTAGAIPGGSLAKTGIRGFVKEALKAAAGNVAAKTVETEVDQGQLPTMGQAGLAGGAGVLGVGGAKLVDTGARAAGALAKKIQNSVRDQTLAEGRIYGYVIPPSKVNPSFLNTALESLAGKAATAQETAARNQELTNALAMKAVGLPANAPITEAALEKVRLASAAPYREIANFSEKAAADLAALRKAKLNTADPHELNILMNDPEIVKEMSPLVTKAKADIEALKQARADASAAFRWTRTNPDPSILKAARDAVELANKLEQQIEDAAQEIGRPGLVDELRAARTRIAKSYEVERALNLGDADVSAPVLGRSLDKGAPLTGELKTIAKFQQAFPQSMREGASVPTAGVSKLKAMAAIGTGAVGANQLGASGALLGLLPFADTPVRKLLLSKPYQQAMGRGVYPGINQPDTLASYIRLATQAGGRNWWEQ